MARDYSREAAHRRYEQAYGTADAAGAITQAAVNNAYLNLLQNTEWTPEENWAEQYQEGPEAYRPASYLGSGWAQTDYGTPYSASPYSVAPEEESKIPDPVTMGLDEDNDLESKSGYEDQQDQDQQQESKSSLSPMFEKFGSSNVFTGSGGGGIDDEEDVELKSQITRPELVTMDDVFMNGGPLDLGNWPILKPTDREKFEAGERANYRSENPIQEGALVYRRPDGTEVPVTSENVQSVSVPVTTEEWQKKYRDYFDSFGGIDESYQTASSDISNVLSNLSDYDAAVTSGDFEAASNALLANGYNLSDALDKLSNENYNDGERMTWDSVKSKNISGPAYRKLVEAGFGGRPIWDIQDDLTYDQLTEMRQYGLVPYIEDEEQARNWDLLQGPESVSKAFSLFEDTRNRSYQPTVDYNGQTINLDELYRQLDRWTANENPDTVWTVRDPISGNVDTFVDNTANFDAGYDVDDEGYLTAITIDFPEAGKHYAFPISSEKDIDRAEEWINELNNSYKPDFGGLSYTQSDGREVNLSNTDEVVDLITGIDDGSIQTNYGPHNLAKDPVYRKDFTQMIATQDPSDLLPATLDILLGSAPLFIKQTAWPMALSNAVVAAEGLDPQVYDSSSLARRRLSDDMNADKYFTNVALNGAVPATENIAGVIGGGHGAFGKVVQKLLEDRGVGGGVRAGVDVLGEGLEEVIAGLWEDAQTNGWRNWYANPIYEKDDNGNVIMEEDPATGEMKPKISYDETGHERRDPNTPIPDRLKNAAEPMLENALGGSWLGFLMGAPGVARDKFTNTGYYDPAYLENAFENANARKMGKSEDIIQFSPEFFEERRRQREEQ